MNYLNFDKSVLTNLDKSLTKEMLRTNRSGAYNSTTLVDCNTRKYHGQLVIPVPQIDGNKHVLLSSLDETIIQHSAEFNLGVHQYEGGHFSPNGHKYIREFTCELISKTIYRVGGVIISKERLMVSNQSRTITKYTLLQAHSATTIRFKPFLAFRSVHELCVANDVASTQAIPATKGAAFCLYEPYPTLYLQFSKQPHYHHQPHWYNHLLYAKEQERGYPCTEDLMVPGYFEMPIKKGESIYFTAGIDEISPAALKKMWENELALRQARVDMYHCLRNAAIQFTKKVENGVYLLAGYPWFKVRARDQFIAMPGCTLSIGENATFVEMATTAMREIDAFMQGECSTSINELDAPDALLWFVWSLQQYASVCDILPADMQDMVVSIVQYIVSQHHPNLFLRKNGLLYVDGTQVPMTWMNATENNQPITPRTGFVVEINALWYNALCFAASLVKKPTLKIQWQQMAEQVAQSFVDTFWNGLYLYDYVNGQYRDVEVRPNMILAVSLPFSPLSRQQQKSVLDVCTRELLTPKGLRSLSPKSGYYRPNYVGGMLERNRNYHNGPVWPWFTGAYAEAYLKIHRNSGISFVERLLIGMEAEMKKLCVGTLSELHDGNPPYKGHGAMSYAPSVGEILRTLQLIKAMQ
ncbi:MAG: amylo-alpha-1,6-glucosidase [Paludibacteraceae bacterium]|jgi:predicted glycogen debranching enzyme|nr:amylo-alpha-1,6-glucosidase [Paludibacteraceae bacterium]